MVSARLSTNYATIAKWMGKKRKNENTEQFLGYNSQISHNEVVFDYV